MLTVSCKLSLAQSWNYFLCFSPTHDVTCIVADNLSFSYIVFPFWVFFSQTWKQNKEKHRCKQTADNCISKKKLFSIFVVHFLQLGIRISSNWILLRYWHRTTSYSKQKFPSASLDSRKTKQEIIKQNFIWK